MVLNSIAKLFRKSTGAKPNFLGIGVAKAGTTTVARILARHPEVSFFKKRKEAHFFDYAENITPDGIKAYFAEFDPNVAVGEFTPSYLFVPECRDRIYDILGVGTRFIVALRNPVDRAFSHYCHAINNWNTEETKAAGYPVEDLDFKDAILQEDERLASGEYHIRHQSYYNKGLYAKQLQWYFEKFPKENFYIYTLEEYKNNPAKILQDLYNFLGVDPTFETMISEVKLNSQTNQPLSDDTRQWLRELYAPSIDELETLLGCDFSHWR